MANTDREITIKVSLDSKGAVIGASRVKDSVQDIEKGTKRADKSARNFGGRTVAVAALAAVAYNKIAGAVKLVLRESFRLATSAEETASKYRTVLGPAVAQTNRFLEENAAKMGLSVTQGREVVATTAAIAQGLGFTQRESAGLSTEIVALAGDLQSFNDVPIEQTHRAITSALTGEREALKTLGIVINEAQVAEQALANTGKDAADALTQQEKATATLQLITERAGVAVGDLNRTQDSTANRARQVQAEFLTLKENMARQLLPAFGAGVEIAGNFVDILGDWIEVPVSEKLKQEQTDLNVLVSRITDTNIAQGDRNQLISDLQSEYPAFLDNLDADTVSNEQLAGRLSEVNQLYIKRIALQAQEEHLQEAIADQSDIMRQKIILEEEARQLAIQAIGDYGLNIDKTGKSLQQLTSEVEQALKQQSGLDAETELGTGAVERRRHTYTELRSTLAALTGAESNLEQAQKQVSEEMELGDQIARQYGTTLGDLEEQMGATTPSTPQGGTVTFDADIDTAELKNLSLASGGHVETAEIEAFRAQQAEKEEARQKELALFEKLGVKTVEVTDKMKSFHEISMAGLDSEHKGLQISQQQWEGLSQNIGMAAAQAIQYADTAREAIRGAISATINQIIAFYVQAALQQALGTGPLALFVAPAATAAAVALAKTVTKPLLNFQQGGLLDGPSHARGGIPARLPGGGFVELEGKEAIINKRSSAMFRDELSAINQAGGGRAFAGGGSVSMASDRQFFRPPALPAPGRGGSAGFDEQALEQAIIRGLARAQINLPINPVDEKLGDFGHLKKRVGNG